MKKKRNFIALAILVAILALGIGYAAITKELTITGTLNATVDNSNFVVEFTAADEGQGIVADSAQFDGMNASFTVDGTKMTTKDNTATATFTITNETTTAVALKAQLSKATIQGVENSKFTVSATDLSSTTLAPGETADVTVTVTLNETPTEAISNEVVTIKYIATAVQ